MQSKLLLFSIQNLKRLPSSFAPWVQGDLVEMFHLPPFALLAFWGNGAKNLNMLCSILLLVPWLGVKVRYSFPRYTTKLHGKEFGHALFYTFACPLARSNLRYSFPGYTNKLHGKLMLTFGWQDKVFPEHWGQNSPMQWDKVLPKQRAHNAAMHPNLAWEAVEKGRHGSFHF